MKSCKPPVRTQRLARTRKGVTGSAACSLSLWPTAPVDVAEGDAPNISNHMAFDVSLDTAADVAPDITADTAQTYRRTNGKRLIVEEIKSCKPLGTIQRLARTRMEAGSAACSSLPIPHACVPSAIFPKCRADLASLPLSPVATATDRTVLRACHANALDAACRTSMAHAPTRGHPLRIGLSRCGSRVASSCRRAKSQKQNH